MAPAVRVAVATAALALALALAAVSPPLRVRAVSWTGSLRLPEARYAALEAACLGRPLFLLSERSLRGALALDGANQRLRLRRHAPHTLEVRLEPRRAVARLDEGRAVDGRGRLLGPEHVLEGLPQLSGFEMDGGGRRLAPESRALLAAVRPLFELPTLAPAAIELEGERLELVLADSGARVRCDAAHAAAQLRKLRIFEQSLGDEPLPGWIDLRYQDQVVVRDGGVGRARRRAR